MINVIKRDGTSKIFNKRFIISAIDKAREEIDGENENIATNIANNIEDELLDKNITTINVETIQDMVVSQLEKEDNDIATAYKDYRQKRSIMREHPMDKTIMELINNKNDFLLKENANKKPELASTQRDLIAGTVSRYLARKMIPKNIIDAHDRGEIKIHDLDYYIQPITNCCLINLKDMFENGTVINNKKIEEPKSLRTAMTLTTQIITQVTSFQYGGCTVSLTHIAKYVRVSKEKIKRKIINRLKSRNKFKYYTVEDIEWETNQELHEEIKDSVQTMNYQINTMNSTNGQSPFSTIFIYLDEDSGEYKEEIAMLSEEIFNQRINGIKDENGNLITQTFPKLIFVLDENNIHLNSEFRWLLDLAEKSTAKRMSPDYESAKVLKEQYGDVFPFMGCRSALTPFKPDGKNYKWYGRLNLGVQTINLPDVALTSKGNMDEFWKILDYRMENFIKPMGILRYEKLKGVKASVSPIMWQHGCFSRLNSDDNITDALDKIGFTISVGYNGIYETVKYMIGKSHTTKEGLKFAEDIMIYLENKCEQWKKETNMMFSLYGTPQEESTDWFTKKMKSKFGDVKDITDKGFVVNSYHVDPREEIDAFSKLEIEGKLQKYSKGGNVSYIEANDLTNNIKALHKVIECIYENNAHAEINSQNSCRCFKCGYEGKMDYDNEKDKWFCPNCKNDDKEYLSIVLRICGYLSEKGVFAFGRMKDILSRVYHL